MNGARRTAMVEQRAMRAAAMLSALRTAAEAAEPLLAELLVLLGDARALQSEAGAMRLLGAAEQLGALVTRSVHEGVALLEGGALVLHLPHVLGDGQLGFDELPVPLPDAGAAIFGEQGLGDLDAGDLASVIAARSLLQATRTAVGELTRALREHDGRVRSALQRLVRERTTTAACAGVTTAPAALALARRPTSAAALHPTAASRARELIEAG